MSELIAFTCVGPSIETVCIDPDEVVSIEHRRDHDRPIALLRLRSGQSYCVEDENMRGRYVAQKINDARATCPSPEEGS